MTLYIAPSLLLLLLLLLSCRCLLQGIRMRRGDREESLQLEATAVGSPDKEATLSLTVKPRQGHKGYSSSHHRKQSRTSVSKTLRLLLLLLQ